jgi:hypothetical protein
MLSDSSPMPFGKWKGRKMKEVPATYLDWLRGQVWLVDWPDVKEYVDKNKKVIDQELADRDYERGED